jgi:hypothetical protein
MTQQMRPQTSRLQCPERESGDWEVQGEIKRQGKPKEREEMQTRGRERERVLRERQRECVLFEREETP